MNWTDFFAIAGTILTGMGALGVFIWGQFSSLRLEIKEDIKQQAQRIDAQSARSDKLYEVLAEQSTRTDRLYEEQAARTDRLYEMFIEIVKRRN